MTWSTRSMSCEGRCCTCNKTHGDGSCCVHHPSCAEKCATCPDACQRGGEHDGAHDCCRHDSLNGALTGRPQSSVPVAHVIGPSLGEIVHLGGMAPLLAPPPVMAEVVAVDFQAESFVVQFDADGTKLNLSLSRYGTTVHCAWDCGHGNQEIGCFLRKAHRGPHLYKLREK